jgi:type II secretory pathway pseudopilin PulG
MQRLLRSTHGLSLVETLVATTVLITALAGVAQLLTSSARFLRDSAREEIALTAAQAQLETLRAALFTYDPSGAPVSDPGLASAPAGSLDIDLEGYSNYLDRAGRTVERADEAAMFRRRWAITPLGSGEPGLVMIEVCVWRLVDAATVPAAGACLATVRTRQP